MKNKYGIRFDYFFVDLTNYLGDRIIKFNKGEIIHCLLNIDRYEKKDFYL